jgi:hypothetical protein
MKPLNVKLILFIHFFFFDKQEEYDLNISNSIIVLSIKSKNWKILNRLV